MAGGEQRGLRPDGVDAAKVRIANTSECDLLSLVGDMLQLLTSSKRDVLGSVRGVRAEWLGEAGVGVQAECI